MRIGGENRPLWIQWKNWGKFGDSVAIKPSFVLKMLKDMSAAIIPAAKTLLYDFTNSYGTCPIIEKIRHQECVMYDGYRLPSSRRRIRIDMSAP